LACRQFLHFLHLDNLGYRHDFNDTNLQFPKDGSDAGSDFGLVGFLALVTSSISIWRPNVHDPKWLLSFAAFATLGLTSLTVAWMPWNARFLCLSFVLMTVAMVIFVFSGGEKSSWTRPLLGVVILWSALSLPFLCTGRHPADLEKSLFAREELTFMQRPDLQQVYDDVSALQKDNTTRWYLVADSNSWVLPFLTMKRNHWILKPEPEQLFHLHHSLSPKNLNFMDDSFVLILNKEMPSTLPGEIVRQYPENTCILRIK
jgi:hypothetical protein